jgi:hypothetical protein
LYYNVGYSGEGINGKVGVCMMALKFPAATTTAAAALAAVQVDATALMCDDFELAAAVMQNTGAHRLMKLVQNLIEQKSTCSLACHTRRACCYKVLHSRLPSTAVTACFLQATSPPRQRRLSTSS